MTLLNFSNANTSLNTLNSIAQDLGLDVWQLQTGSYNGQPFYTTSTLSSLNSKYDPAAGLVSATKNLIGAIPDNTNTTTKAGSNNNLPFGTGVTATGIFDSGVRKVAWFSPPNNYDGWETQGWQGETFVIRGILWGAAYSTALANILNCFINDANVVSTDSSSLHVLVHPIMGRIENVLLLKYQRIHNPNMWRSCMYEFTFRANQPVGTVSNGRSSIYNIINTTISSVLTIATAINNTWGDVSVLARGYGTSGNTSSVQQSLKKSQTALTTTTNTSVYLTQQMINNLAPSGYTNVSLNNYEVTDLSDTPQVYYWESNMTPNDVYSLLSYMDTVINDCIDVINVINTNVIYDTISDLTSLQTSMSSLGEALINSFYGNTKEYTVSINSSLLNICFLNNINFTNQVNKILLLNKGVIFNVDYITKGTVLLLPISTTSGSVV